MPKLNHVCIIDDDHIFLYLTQMLIEKTALVRKIKVFAQGREALEYIQSAIRIKAELPDAIFLDLNMPIMDGWDFLEEFGLLKQELDKKIDIYIVSSSIDPNDLERAKSISDVTDFVIKPLSEEQFLQMMERQ